MDLGKQIRENRLRSNFTQERLAERLNVTPQAVSKWESGQSMPDITLLPELSALFGITIDELFETGEETHLNRIENMLERSPMLSREDFDYAVHCLEAAKQHPEYRGRCLTLMADLYWHRSRGYADKAAELAREALELEPEKKDNHSLLSHAMNGTFWDWGCTNHTRLIDYYKTFVKKHPAYHAGYMWLMDNLIEDGRLDEAREALAQMRKVKESYHALMYAGRIAMKEGDRAEANRLWREMTETYGDIWFAWSVRADSLAKQGCYAQAIEAYEKASSLQSPPRFTDNQDSIAQLCLLLGDRQGAIKAYERVVEILRTDWGLTEGETVEGYLQNIAQLKRE